jgi:hypothetical protein
MDTSRRRQLPLDLERGRRRFQEWRGQRKAGGRIPQALWTMAARMAKVHGVSRTAGALGLDYYSVKKRAEAVAGESRSSGTPFVELTAPVPVGKQCLLELDDGAGVTMRVQLVGYDAAEVEALARGVWSTR